MHNRLAIAAVLVSLSWLSPAFGQQLQDLNELFGDSSPASGQQQQQQQQPDLEHVEELIVQRVNDFRKKHDLAPLAPNDSLTLASEDFAGYMARTNRYGHTADGTRPADRAKEAGYELCIVLENIAYRYSSEGFGDKELARGFVRGWKNSPGHRENMLDPDVTQTGVGVARSDDGKYFAVQMFGRPKSAMISVKIRNRAGAPIDYTLGGRAYSLPARYTRTHSVCRPPELQFDSLDRTLRPDDGAEIVLRREDGELVASQDDPRV